MSGTKTDEDSGRRWRSPLVASLVAAVLVVAGGGGTYLATAGFGAGDGPDARSGEPPRLSVSPTPTGALGIAPGEPHPGPGSGYRVKGALPDGPDRASVHRPEGTVTEDEVRRLAQALGLPGSPRRTGSVWKAGGDKDGSGPVLQVSAAAPGTWTYGGFGPAPRGDACPRTDVCASGTTASGPTSPDGVPPVSEKAAKHAAAPVLKALGQSDAAVDAGQVMGAIRVVNAEPVVGGLPTHGWTTGIQIGADGRVVGGGGQLKEPRARATYPVISADDALARLNTAARGGGAAEPADCPTGGGRSGGAGGMNPCDVPVCATPMPLGEGGGKETAKGPARACAPGCPPPASPGDTTRDRLGCGGLPPEPAERLTVDKAVFGLSALHADGKPSLVPSWLFRIAPGGAAPSSTIAQVAVEPGYLVQSTPPSPDAPGTPEVSPLPTAPGTGTGPARPAPDPDGPSRALPGQSVESYTVQGRTLTVRFTGGVCAAYGAKASETGRQVRVTITESHPDPGRVCIAVAVPVTAKVTLDAPLGDREVVDARTGKAIKPGTG
ncbi:hypothetical protein ACFYT4_18730 [Streptomyces sp. NPDC004609]|uniref:hypothetical protein n=1 Tax=Streptomyces sp. NPDC004609 TaxID=3364704 RepID=UPI0036A1A1CB